MALCLFRWNSFCRFCLLWRGTCIAFWMHLWGLEGSWRWRWYSCFCCSGRFLRTRSLGEAASFGSWCVQKCLIECFWRVLWSKNVKHMFCLLIYNKEDLIWVTSDYLKIKRPGDGLKLYKVQRSIFNQEKKETHHKQLVRAKHRCTLFCVMSMEDSPKIANNERRGKKKDSDFVSYKSPG